jgi:hypothetical protein
MRLVGLHIIGNCSLLMVLGEPYTTTSRWLAKHYRLILFYSYAVDSLVLLLQSVIASQAFKELGPTGYSAGLTIAVYGTLFPALSRVNRSR